MQAMDNQDDGDRLITAEERRALVPLSDSQVWRQEQAGKFPRRIKLSSGQGGRVVWSFREIKTYIAARKAARPSNTDTTELQAPDRSSVG
jgi:predicted DNA-binding transcriptional regulator AlpA